MELPDNLFREVKTLAARQGRSIKEIVHRAIEKEVSRSRRAARRYAVKLPMIHSKHPGALRSLTNAEMEDLLD